MRKTEFEGEDIHAALREAAAALGIPEPDLHYEIVEQGRRGLFGLGARAVRIRVLPPVDPVGVELKPPAAKADDRPQGDDEAAPRPRRPRERPARRPAGDQPPRVAPEEVPPEAVAAVESTIQRMVSLLGLELTVRGQVGPEGLEVVFEGSDQEKMLQKDGELLLAMQFLLTRMLRRLAPQVGRIHLTCGDGRRDRDEDLVEMAREAAQLVSQTGRPKRLRPMNAYERRLVHLTIRETDGLTSQSEGAGAMKRVRIAPA